MKYFHAKLLGFLLKHLYNAVTIEDILQIKGRRMLIGGKLVDEAKADALVRDAKAFQDSIIWQVLKNHPLWDLNERAYKKSANIGGMLFCRAGNHIVELQEKLLKLIADWNK